MSDSAAAPRTSSCKPSMMELASTFGRFGNATFGGGSATIAVLHEEIVSKRRWISEQIFALCYALSRATPGTNLLAFETGVGWVSCGWWGAFVSLTAGSIPCSVLAVLATLAYEVLRQNLLVVHAIRGALAATVGLIFVTSVELLRPHLSRGKFIAPIAIALCSFLAVWKLAAPPILVLGLAAIVGYFLPERRPA